MCAVLKSRGPHCMMNSSCLKRSRCCILTLMPCNFFSYPQVKCASQVTDTFLRISFHSTVTNKFAICLSSFFCISGMVIFPAVVLQGRGNSIYMLRLRHPMSTSGTSKCSKKFGKRTSAVQKKASKWSDLRTNRF